MARAVDASIFFVDFHPAPAARAAEDFNVPQVFLREQIFREDCSQQSGSRFRVPVPCNPPDRSRDWFIAYFDADRFDSGRTRERDIYSRPQQPL